MVFVERSTRAQKHRRYHYRHSRCPYAPQVRSFSCCRMSVAALDRAYGNKPTATRLADIVLLIVAVVLAALLAYRGVEPTSFLGGLWIGGTLIQLYFHRFHEPLDDEQAPPPVVSPIKMMSYAIQAKPNRPPEWFGENIRRIASRLKQETSARVALCSLSPQTTLECLLVARASVDKPAIQKRRSYRS